MALAVLAAGLVAMFLAIRDIRFARGRFALMTTVVALVTVLLVLLSSLTRGLGAQNTSALDSLPGQSVLLSPAGDQTSWDDSVIEPATVTRLTGAQPVRPLVVTRARMELDGRTGSVVVLGSDANHPAGTVALGRSTAEDLGAEVGSTLELNGTRLRVGAVDDDLSWSHQAVAWTSVADANAIGHLPAGQATALLVDGDVELTGSGLVELSRTDAIAALPGYSSEHGSLVTIQGFLYGVSGLVVLAFLSVWTVQRTRDIAVLRALGATRRYVLGDSLGQAALLLAAGVALGSLFGTGLALLAARAVPVLVAPGTTVVPALGVLAVGLLGSVLATRRVTTVDPLLALGGN